MVTQLQTLQAELEEKEKALQEEKRVLEESLSTLKDELQKYKAAEDAEMAIAANNEVLENVRKGTVDRQEPKECPPSHACGYSRESINQRGATTSQRCQHQTGSYGSELETA